MELHITFMSGATDVLPLATRPTPAEAGALIRERFLTPAFSFRYVWHGIEGPTHSTPFYSAVDN